MLCKMLHGNLLSLAETRNVSSSESALRRRRMKYALKEGKK